MKRRLHLDRIRRGSALCHYCGLNLNRGQATVDHVVPRALGGTVSKVNVVPACEACNNSKGDTFPTCKCPHCEEAVVYFVLHRLVRGSIQPRLHEMHTVGPGLATAVVDRL